MLFNHGGGFFTPKNFVLPQHFTPKTFVAQSTTTNESCSLMLDSDLRSATYVLKSSKESTIHHDTNSTQGDQKNVRMIEYEEFQKSNSPSVQSSQEQRNHYLVDINTGSDAGRLISEGIIGNIDQEERNQITPSNQILSFKLKQNSNNNENSDIKEEEDYSQFSEEQIQNLNFNDYWIKQVKLDHNLQNISQQYNEQNQGFENKINLGSNNNVDDSHKNIIGLRQNNEQQLIEQIDDQQFNLQNSEQRESSERSRTRKIIMKEQHQNKFNRGQKNKILVQDQNYEESIIYEEEDSENSKSTDRQYQQFNRSLMNQITGPITTSLPNMSSAKNESISKTRSNQNHQNSRHNISQNSQTVKEFLLEEDQGIYESQKLMQSQQQQQQYKNNSKLINKDSLQEIITQNEKQSIQIDNNDNYNENNHQLNQQQFHNQFQNNISQQQQQQQNQSDQNINNNIMNKENKNSYCQMNKSRLSINNIDTNFQNDRISRKSYTSFNQISEQPSYEFFGASKKDVQKQQQNNQQMIEQQNNEEYLEINQFSEDKSNNNQLNITNNQEPIFIQNQSQSINKSSIDFKPENREEQMSSDKLFYPNQSNFYQPSLHQSLNSQQIIYQQDKIEVPIQKLNFDHCESSNSSARASEEPCDESILLKQNFHNLINNFKSRPQSLPQSNSNNNIVNNRILDNNSNENQQITNSFDDNNNHNKSIEDSQYQINQCFQKNRYLQKKLEESLDKNNTTEFFLIKKLQVSHSTSQQMNEKDIVQSSEKHFNKKLNKTINQTYILEETGEDFIFNQKELEKLEQIDNSYLMNNKENMGNSSLNLDSRVLLADTIYSSCNTSHLYFINNLSSEKRILKSQQKDQNYIQNQLNSDVFQYQQQQQNQFNHGGNNRKKYTVQGNTSNNNNNNYIQQDEQNNNLENIQKQKQQQQQQQNQGFDRISKQSMNKMTQQNDGFLQEIDYLKKEVIKLNKDLQNIDVQNCKYQEIIDQQQTNILRLEDKLIHYKEELKMKQQQLDTKDIQINKLFEEKEQLKTKKKKLKDQLQSKDIIISQQKQVISTFEQGSFKNLQSELEEKIAILNEKDNHFDSIHKKNTDLNQLLLLKTEQIYHLKSENQSMREEIDLYNKSSHNYNNQLGNSQLEYISSINNSKFNTNHTSNNNINNNNNNLITQSLSQFQNPLNNQLIDNSEKQNQQRLRSYSSNTYNGQQVTPSINQNSLTTSQPYNYTEESQDNNNIIHQRSSSSFCNSNLDVNQSQNLKQEKNQNKINPQLRYSYDNYKNYQKNNQIQSNPQELEPITLNSAIAQFKYQALKDRQLTETNSHSSNNLNSHLNKSNQNESQSFYNSKEIAKVSSSTFNTFNENDSINQFANKSQISTSCNSRHQESSHTQNSNSQICSSNNSQKSLSQLAYKQQQQQQQNKSSLQNSILSQNTQSIKEPIYNKDKLSHIQNNINNNYKQIINDKDDNNKNIRSQNLNDIKSQKLSHLYKDNNLNSIHNQGSQNNNNNGLTEDQIIQRKYLHNNYIQKNEKLLQNNNNNQKSLKLNSMSYERVSTSPNRSKNDINKTQDLSEYNSVPLYNNNNNNNQTNQNNENNNFLEQSNRINNNNNYQKKGQLNIGDIVAINDKINQNYQQINNLKLQYNPSSKSNQYQQLQQQQQQQLSSQNKSSQHQNQMPYNNYIQQQPQQQQQQQQQYHHPTSDNQNQMIDQQKYRREHSQSLHQPQSSLQQQQQQQIQYQKGMKQNQLSNSYNTNNIDPNNMIYIDSKNQYKKPPRQQNEIRQSLQPQQMTNLYPVGQSSAYQNNYNYSEQQNNSYDNIQNEQQLSRHQFNSGSTNYVDNKKKQF